MRKQEFRNLLKNKGKQDLQKILYKHINLEINLTSKQIDEILKKRGGYNARDYKRNNTTRIRTNEK